MYNDYVRDQIESLRESVAEKIADIQLDEDLRQYDLREKERQKKRESGVIKEIMPNLEEETLPDGRRQVRAWGDPRSPAHRALLGMIFEDMTDEYKESLAESLKAEALALKTIAEADLK